MTLKCIQCEKVIKEGEEIEGIFRAFYHAIPSEIHFSITKPHDYLKETIIHTDCRDHGGI